MFEIHHQSLFPAYAELLETLVDGARIHQIPILSLCADLGFPIWSMLFILAYLLYKRKYRAMAPLVPLLVFWLTLLVAPVALSRYVLPLVMALPAIWSVLLLNTRETKPQENIITT